MREHFTCGRLGCRPVSFIEDCAVPLEHLADYTDAVTDVFTRHGTRGTWYAHASVGCLHVRPILNMKNERDIKTTREIAENPEQRLRLTLGLRKRAGRWVVVHEHHSFSQAPV